jgi:hypothetical protein
MSTFSVSFYTLQNPFKKPHANLTSVPEEPDIDSSVGKTKKRLLNLRNKELRHTKKNITPQKPTTQTHIKY